MAELTDAQIGAILREEVASAMGADLDGGALAANRARATDYALGRAGGGAPPAGTSRYVSHAVGDTIDAILGELLPSFTGDVVARFEEQGPEDTMAGVESDVVSDFIMDRNPGAILLHDSIYSILAHKNGILKVWIEDEEITEYRDFDDVTTAATVAAIAEQGGLNASIDGGRVSASKVEQRLRIDTVEPELFIYANNHRSIDLTGIRFCGEYCYHTRAELADMGVSRKLLDTLKESAPYTKSDEMAKNLDSAARFAHSATRDQEEVRCASVYRLMPKGLRNRTTATQSELWWFLYAVDSDVLLLKERADFLPYAVGVAWKVPGRFEGMSVYDKLAPIADAETDLTRQMLENARAANNGRVVYNDRIDPADLLNQRANAVINAEGAGPVGDAVMPLGATDILTPGLAFLNYFSSVRTERVGASVDMSSPEFQVMGDTAHGAERMMSAREVRSGKNATMIAETLVRSLWLLVHKTLRRHWRGQVMARVAGRWQPVAPMKWPERERVTITHGMSPGERIRKAQALGGVLQTQMQLYQMGAGIFVSPREINNTLMDMARAQGLDAPERYYVDPDSEASQQAAQGASQAAQQEKATALQVETLGEQIKLQIAQMDDKRERDIAILKAEIEQMKVVGTATADLEKEQLRLLHGGKSQGETGTGSA